MKPLCVVHWYLTLNLGCVIFKSFVTCVYFLTLQPNRYDNRGPTAMEGSWHSRSSSEHSYLSQNSRPQVGFEESPTVFASPPSTPSPDKDDAPSLTPTGQPRGLQSTFSFSEPPSRRYVKKINGFLKKYPIVYFPRNML